jgi:hypothetical protein
MNETMIENILVHAPRPAAPADLLKKLNAEISLPTKKVIIKSREWRSPLRRWFPALAFGVLMLSCAIMIAVQSSWSTNLKRQNEALRAATSELPQLREQHAALEQAQAQQDELAQLRKDNQEVHQLQTEVAQLSNLSAQVQQLQNENKRLAAALATPASTSSGNFFDDAAQQLSQAKQRAERIQCVNDLKQVGLAFRIWGGDHNDKFPTSLVVMSNELSTTKILVCPSDTARQPYASLGFGQFQDSMTSYVLTVQPDDGNMKYPQCIIAKCPIHGNYLLADGSVQQVNLDKPAYREVQKDGRWYLEPVVPGATWRDSIIQTIK